MALFTAFSTFQTMPFLLFSKHVAFSYLPVTIRLHPPSFTCAIFSALSSSASSNASTPPNVISKFLLNECGFRSTQITKIMKRRPSLLRTRNDHTARKAILFLRDSGFTDNRLHKTIVNNPSILTSKVDGQLNLKMEFMKTLGFAPQDIAILISRQPRLLTFSLERSLRPKIPYLKNLFGSNVNLCKALVMTPVLLGSDVEKQLKPKVEYIENNMGILRSSATFLYALHEVVTLGFENVARKLKHLESLGLSEEEVHHIVKKFPPVLHISTKKIQENRDFLIDGAGLTHRTLVSNPALFSLSLEKRLKPRYEVFKSLSSKPHSKGPPSLLSIFTISEKYFLQKFGQCVSQGKSIGQSPKSFCSSHGNSAHIIFLSS